MSSKKKTSKTIPVTDSDNVKPENADTEAANGDLTEPVEEPEETQGSNEHEEPEFRSESDENDPEFKLMKMTENWQRERASFQNYKKRIEEEKRLIRRYASFDFAYDLLKVLDYFDSSVSFAENVSDEARSVIIGVEYTLKELIQVLASHGVSPVDVEIGGELDSRSMEAVERRETGDHEPGRILEVLRKGWNYYDRVLRPAQVVVSVAGEDVSENNAKEEG